MQENDCRGLARAEGNQAQADREKQLCPIKAETQQPWHLQGLIPITFTYICRLKSRRHISRHFAYAKGVHLCG